jgi:tetratricopeptide (TPR) repeat protein
MINPTVFISYSHDSPEHSDRVLELSNRLRGDGINCTIDQYEVSPAEGWPKWMDRQLANSNFVLVVCTETYHRRVMGEEEKGKGLGVKWESTISYQSIYDADSANTRFIPIFFESGKTEFIPQPMKGATYYLLPQQYEGLYRRLTNQPKVLKPELGSLKTFEPLAERERKTDFFEGTTLAWHLAHPYPMPPNFTGRAAEQKMLDDWLADDKDRLFLLRALGGFGKSALTWQWINTRVDPTEWTKVVFWSFYEGDASFEHFIEETLKYLKIEVPQGQRPQVDELLKAMQGGKILLIMDGFERLLRAYGNMNASHQGDDDKKLKDFDRDCVNLNVEHFLKGICSMPNMKSKALMTTRLTPRALEKYGQFIQGCREEELKAMYKDYAIAFFRAQGVRKGTNHEIEEVCRLYGFHPLSLRLLAGHIMADLKNAGDIIVAQKLKVSGDVMEHQNHILEVAYNGLPPRQQKLLSMIACFRSSTNLDTLESIAENKDTLDEDLRDLMERGLVQFDKTNSIFDLHPIVRRFAYDRLTTPDRTSAHVVIVVYFEAVPQPQKIEKLEDLAPIIELYHHMVRAGNLDEARKLFHDRLHNTLHYQFGAYQIIVELISALFLDGEDKPPRLKDESAHAWTFNVLANAYSLSGQPRRAIPPYTNAIELFEKLGNKESIAYVLGAVASVAYMPIGSLRAAELNMQRRINIGLEIEDTHLEAIGRTYFGWLLAYKGSWKESLQELDSASRIFIEEKHIQGQGFNLIHCSIRALLMIRDHVQSEINSPKFLSNTMSAIEFAQHAIDLAEEEARLRYPTARDFVRAHWQLGAAYRYNNQLDLADHHLTEALKRDRTINLVTEEADILLDLARLRYDQKNYNEAKSLAEEALSITERCGYILQDADVNLFLAQYALEQEKDKAKAKQYAETALKLATCDGPPYYYKVAYEEAERMLEKLA